MTAPGLVRARGLIALAALAACSVPPPADAIAAVLAADDAAGRRRNHAPEHGPVAAAVRAYVAELDGLDLEACPDDFAGALRRHRDAWAATAGYLDGFPDERGEMHAVFDRLAADANPTAARFGAMVDRIWSTWAEVEAAARRHGALPAEDPR